MLKIGDKAPDFTLPDAHETDVQLSSFAGKKVILYFYPKDDTPGCTQEASAFTELYDLIRKKNAIVLGVSKDSSQSHRNFMEKYGLRLTLLSDTQARVIKQYGAWGEKARFGNKTMGTLRKTFLIDENGLIAQIWDAVAVPGHAQDVCGIL